MINESTLFVDRAGVIRTDLIPLAAFLCAEEYDAVSRGIILDHAAAGAPLADLTCPTPDGHLILEPVDLAGAEEALGRGGPAAAPIAGGAPSPAEVVTIEPTANGQPRTLAEVVDHEALAYRAWGTPTGDFLAAQMERVAQLIRWTGATTPQDHEDRMEVWDRQIRDDAFDRGYHAAQSYSRR